jgi:hypothetical protein
MRNFKIENHLRTVNRQPSKVNRQRSTVNRQQSKVKSQPSTVKGQPSTVYCNLELIGGGPGGMIPL